MTDDVPQEVRRAFEDHEGFAAAGSAYRVTTTVFEARVTAADGDDWRTDYEVTVTAPALSAATADEVGPAVAEGWFETLERRLADAPQSTRRSVDLDAFAAERAGDEVVVTYAFALGSPEAAAAVAKAFVEYVEGTYVEGVVPGYDYEGAVADLLGEAASAGGSGEAGGTPL